MIHTLFKENDYDWSISVSQNESSPQIIIKETTFDGGINEQFIELTPKELSDFIGILLHVQAKIKRDNGK